MSGLVAHLSVSELEERFTACRETRTARQTQAIWLLAKGHSFAEAAAATAFSKRWVRRLCERYNAEGPEALGDRRRHGGAAPSILTPEALDQVRRRLVEPPADGDVWTSRKVAEPLRVSQRLQLLRGWSH